MSEGPCTAMDSSGYSKWTGRPEEAPAEPCGCWGRKALLVALAVTVSTALWALILSVLLSKASTERGLLVDHQGLLRTNASQQAATLGSLQQKVGACTTCCSEAQAQLKTTRAELGEAQKKLLEQRSTLEELRDSVTKNMAQAGRDRDAIRTELLRALEAAKLGNNSCEPCPRSWLPFEGSCYLFSEQKNTWETALNSCQNAGAHLVIVDDLEEQSFLSGHTRGRGFWLGLKAVRHLGKIQSYQWVDGVQLTFSYWNVGEPNDSRGRENCIMMLHTGLWNDAPCDNERDNWICEKKRRC
ncbi:C-type lectin domain family 4 member G [Tenrec ecaudatus]|uniref:C-type lectin domain family 4 member G n=1 Tax=Tenrec ecaudatus TaxID=94439 RepID=UPI003F5A6A70